VKPAPIAAKLRDLGMKNEKRMVEISIYGIKLLILRRFIAYNKNNKIMANKNEKATYEVASKS
jgi:hypothetical protein